MQINFVDSLLPTNHLQDPNKTNSSKIQEERYLSYLKYMANGQFCVSFRVACAVNFMVL